MWKSKEQMKEEQDYIKMHCRIIDYAADMGFHVVKIGHYYTLKEHDSVRIDPEKNCFWQNSTSVSGSIIDFAMHFQSLTFRQAMNYFCMQIKGELPSVDLSHQKSNVKIKKNTAFRLPEKDQTMKHIFAYLVQYRKIKPDIVKYMVYRKLLYQDIRHNCVFIGYDASETPVFACQRGTLTNRRYVGDISGSNYDWCIYIDNGSERLIVCESAIDAMSLMCYLSLNNIDKFDYLILTATTKYQVVGIHLQRLPRIRYVYLALDNDNAGFIANLKIQEKLSELHVQWETWVPKLKDWNDDWKENVKHVIRW